MIRNTLDLSGLLYINNVDVWLDYSVFLAEESHNGTTNYNALLRPAKMKAHTSVSLREEAGERYAERLLPMSEGRDIELMLAIVADDACDFSGKWRDFVAFLKKGKNGSGWLELEVPIGCCHITMRCFLKEFSGFTLLSLLDAPGIQAATFKITLREPKPSI